MAGKYIILAELQIDQTQVQNALNAVSASKPVSIKTNVQMDAAQIDSQIQLWQNKLDKLQVLKPDAFNTKSVQEASANVQVAINAFSGLKGQTKDVQVAFSDLDLALARYNATQQDTIKDGMNMQSMIETGIRKVVVWAIATEAIYGTLRAMQSGSQYVSDLNKELTTLQMITNMNEQQVSSLGLQYNNLAKELGSTTLEVVQGSEMWLRQGKTLQETNDLLKVTIMMTNMTGISSKEAADYLTAIINAFQMQASDAMSVLDKMVVLANSSQTTASVGVDQLAQAIQRSGDSAKQAGVSFNELLSYITTVETVTQKSAESIGESFKTIFARMESVKAGAQLDSEGEALNNVEKSLRAVGIALRDTEGNFKPMGEVIDEIAKKWNTWNNVQQAEISTSIAGVRQKENFLALMANYNKALEYQTAETNSAGVATDRYGFYLDSVQAHANKLTDSLNKMWSVTINTDAIKFMYDFEASIVDLITQYGGLQTVIMAVVAALVILKSELIATSIAGLVGGMGESIAAIGEALVSLFAAMSSGASITEVLSIAFQGLSISISSVVAAIAVLAYSYIKINQAQNDGLKETKNAWENYFDTITKGGTDSQTILNALQNKVNELDKTYKSFGGTLQIIANLLGRQQDVETQGFQAASNALTKTTKSYADYINQVQKAANAIGYTVDAQGHLVKTYDAGMGSIGKYDTGIKVATADQWLLAASTKGIDDAAARWLKTSKQMSDSMSADSTASNTLKQAMSDLKEMVSGPLGKAFSDFTTKQDELFKKAAELKARIAEASTYPSTQKQQDELFKLRQELEATNQDIDKNAQAYDKATKTILFDMMMQRLTAMEADKSIDQANKDLAFSMVMDFAKAWGLVDESTANALGSMNQAFADLQNGNINGAIDKVATLKAWLDSLVGTYNEYIVIHTIYEQGNPEADKGRWGMGGNTNPPSGTKPAIPPGGFYPGGSGLKGGGGGGKKSEQESINDLLRMAVDYIKQQKEAEKELLTEKQKELEAELKLKQDNIKAEQEVLKIQQESLKKQLEGYNKIIDARKAILSTEQQEQTYEQDINDKNKSISQLQQQLAVLALDNSQESKAKQLKIQEELNKQMEELQKTQLDHSYKMKTDALDKEAATYKDYIDSEVGSRQTKIDDLTKLSDSLKPIYDAAKQVIQDQIDKIDDFLKKSGLINQEAIAMIKDKSTDFYKELVKWNSVYGTGVKEDVTRAWNEAYAALKKYKDLADAISGPSKWGGSSADQALIGNSVTSKAITSVLGTITSGGFGLGTSNMGSSVLSSMPQIVNALQSAIGGQVIIGNLINVEGNVDKSMSGELNTIADKVMSKLVSTLVSRGYIRNAQIFTS